MSISFYGLIDPRESNHIRYVGRTKNPHLRLMAHIREFGGVGSKRKWINTLQEQGINPQMVILEEYDEKSPKRLIVSVEEYYIKKYLQLNHNLTNGRMDGKGNSIGTLSETGRLSIQLAQRRRKERRDLLNRRIN